MSPKDAVERLKPAVAEFAMLLDVTASSVVAGVESGERSVKRHVSAPAKLFCDGLNFGQRHRITAQQLEIQLLTGRVP